MNILVTGGAGYIGSIVVEKLLLQNHRVIVIDNLQEGHRAAVLSEAVFYERDIGDKHLLKSIFRKHKIEFIMHFAAETTIEFSMSDPGRYFQNNVVNGIILLDIMREFHCDKFIFSSTAAAYGEPKYIPLDENHITEPINAYGESKLMFEHILEWYHHAYGLKYNNFRYFNAAGATEKLGEDHKHESHLIPLIIKAAMKKNDYIEIFGTNYNTKDGTCIRDYIHVSDIAKAHILAIDNLERNPNAVYNLGNGNGFSVKEVVECVKRITSKAVKIKEGHRRMGDPAVLVASSTKAKAELGWNPAYPDLEQIVESAWKWHSKYPKGYCDYK